MGREYLNVYSQWMVSFTWCYMGTHDTDPSVVLHGHWAGLLYWYWFNAGLYLATLFNLLVYAAVERLDEHCEDFWPNLIQSSAPLLVSTSTGPSLAPPLVCCVIVTPEHESGVTQHVEEVSEVRSQAAGPPWELLLDGARVQSRPAGVPAAKLALMPPWQSTPSGGCGGCPIIILELKNKKR